MFIKVASCPCYIYKFYKYIVICDACVGTPYYFAGFNNKAAAESMAEDFEELKVVETREVIMV